MIIGNNKSLITAMLTMVAGIAFAQSPGHCSIYVRLKGEARAFNAMAKQHGLPSMSRKVKSAQLFNSLDTSKQGSMVKKMMSTTAYSLHVGDAMQNCYRIDLANVTDGQAALEAVKSLPEVEMAELAEPIPVMQATSTVTMPADPLLHLNEINGSWHLQQIGYDKIYGQYAASANVKVAVVDNAVWAGHPDLDIKPENQYFAYIDEVGNSAPPSNIDQEEDCLGPTSCQASLWSHGTHCAGLVAAITGNGEGIASVASGVTLLAARTADSDPQYMNKSLEGVLWAIDRGANVLSLSWGSTKKSEFLEEAIATAIAQGITVVAAAGNDGKDIKQYPAAYPGVIAVGSVDSDNIRSSFSNYGPWVTLAAPGGFYVNDQGEVTSNMILSTTFSTSHLKFYGSSEIDGLYYDGKIGTSMATPLTASVVALMLSVNPSLTPAEIKDILVSTATPTSTWDMAEGSGVVNAFAAVQKAESMASGIENTEIAKSLAINIKDKQLHLSAPAKHLTIADIAGNTIASMVNVGQSVDISNLARGIYIVTAHNGKSSTTCKIAVK